MSDKKARSLDKALTIAGDLFASRRYEDVTMGEVARASKCSTTTLYEVFGGKEGLYLQAMLRVIAVRSGLRTAMTGPGDPSSPPKPGFLQLMRLAEAHARFMAAPETRNTFRALIGEARPGGRADLGKAMQSRLAQLKALLRTEVEAAIAEGDLQPIDPQDAVETILAITAWRPMLLALLFGDDHPVGRTPHALVAQALAPLATKTGAAKLAAFMERENAGPR